MLNFAINNEAEQGSVPTLPLTNQPPFREVGIMAESSITKPKRICQVLGCKEKCHAKGYCGTHYMQLLTHGNILKHTRNNEIKIKGDDCFIQLYNKKGKEIAVTVVDANDFDLVKKYKWFRTHGKYVATTIENKKVYLSRYLMNPPDEVEIDHKDRNPLNNRRSNLRIATSSQNKINLIRKNPSGFRGIYWNKDNLNWRARIQYKHSTHEIGSFSNKEDAARAYNEHAVKLHGEFAILNDV